MERRMWETRFDPAISGPWRCDLCSAPTEPCPMGACTQPGVIHAPHGDTLGVFPSPVGQWAVRSGRGSADAGAVTYPIGRMREAPWGGDRDPRSGGTRKPPFACVGARVRESKHAGVVRTCGD